MGRPQEPATARDPWVAIDAAVDPRAWARELRRVHDRVVSGGSAPRGLRTTILDSWRRSAARGARPNGDGAPDAIDLAELEERRRAHPIRDALPAIRGVLGPAMRSGDHIMVVSDADGVLLWVEGPARAISQAADEMNFLPGSDWSEGGVGTNSIGTALAADHAIQVFSAEHFNAACHGWTCSGAPVHDPSSGRVVGAIDLTSDLSRYHPTAHALVLAAARVAESVMGEQAARRDQQLISQYLKRLSGLREGRSGVVSADGRVLAAFPDGWAGTRIPRPPAAGGYLPRAGVHAEPLLEGLGHMIVPADGPVVAPQAPPDALPEMVIDLTEDDATACVLHGRRLTLSPRHSQLVRALAAHREGLTGPQLATLVYGPDASAVTLRSELSRLRSVLGDVIASRPYRLLADVTLIDARGDAPAV